jgi:hypothetical protein
VSDSQNFCFETFVISLISSLPMGPGSVRVKGQSEGID